MGLGRLQHEYDMIPARKASIMKVVGYYFEAVSKCFYEEPALSPPARHWGSIIVVI